MSTVRINKFFTEQGFCSRRAADRMIGEGRVRINGRVAVLGDQLANGDVVTVDGRVVSHRPQPVYLAYHKPVGVTCTTEPHVAGNIVHAVGYPERIFPIGRIRIMQIRLGDLPVAKWRHLTPKEREELLTAVGLHEEETKAAS